MIDTRHDRLTHSRALFYALTGYAVWVLHDICTKTLGMAGIPPTEIIGFIGVGGMLSLPLFGNRLGHWQDLAPKRPFYLMSSAGLAVAGTLCNIVAVRHLPFTSFYTIVFSGTIINSVMAALFLHEPLHGKKLIAILGGFLGVLIAINPFVEKSSGEMIGYFAGGFSVIANSVATLRLRVATKSDNLLSMMFTWYLIAMICGFGIAMPDFVTPQPWQAALLMVAGFLSLFGRILVFHAMKFTDVANVMQCNYSQIIWAAIAGYFIWHQFPTLHMAAGAVLIITSGLVIADHARKRDSAVKA